MKESEIIREIVFRASNLQVPKTEEEAKALKELLAKSLWSEDKEVQKSADSERCQLEKRIKDRFRNELGLLPKDEADRMLIDYLHETNRPIAATIDPQGATIPKILDNQ